MTGNVVQDVFEPKFDVVPLIIELSCLGGLIISLVIFEVIYQKGLIFKGDQEGPTKIHVQHLKEYKKQEDGFLANGGQANPVRRRERPDDGNGHESISQVTSQGVQMTSGQTRQSQSAQ